MLSAHVAPQGALNETKPDEATDNWVWGQVRVCLPTYDADSRLRGQLRMRSRGCCAGGWVMLRATSVVEPAPCFRCQKHSSVTVTLPLSAFKDEPAPLSLSLFHSRSLSLISSSPAHPCFLSITFWSPFTSVKPANIQQMYFRYPNDKINVYGEIISTQLSSVATLINQYVYIMVMILN